MALFKRTKWRRVEGMRWWPTQDANDKTVKTLSEAYESLYVDDVRTILATIPRLIDRRKYMFEIVTNNGGRIRETTIDALAIYFPFAYREWWYEE
jgi:hypothetical protein